MADQWRPIRSHERIRFGAHEGDTDETLDVRYLGHENDIVAAGIATPDMLKPGRGGRREGASRVDQEGAPFSLVRQQKGIVRLTFRNKPEEIVLRRFPGLVADVSALCGRLGKPRGTSSPGERATVLTDLEQLIKSLRSKGGAS